MSGEMRMSKDFLDHINSPHHQQFRKAVVVNKFAQVEQGFLNQQEHQVNLLLSWAADHCYEYGYEPDDIAIIQNAFDYGREQGLGIEFMATKKPEQWNSLLFWFHKRQQEQKEELSNKNLDLQVKKAQIAGLKELNRLTWKVFGITMVVLNIAWLIIHNN
jgi:hypothetical protein